MSGYDEDETEYRIEFTIQRQQPGEEDFTEIGFGSSGGWTDLDMCAHMVNSAIQNGEWETEARQPAPSEILTAITAAEAARD